MNENESMDYAKAGVDRDKEEETVKSILEIIKTTFKNSEIPEGHFASSITFGEYLLSLATDGVGSKLLLAQEFDIYNTIGVDCVAMNVNDIITIGSIPHAFVDYIAVRSPDQKLIAEIVNGLAQGCIEAEVPLIGGETAVLPELITEIKNGNGFDVAGTVLGIHKKSESVTGEDIKPGDTIIGIRSSGIHSNGLTLARKVLKRTQNRKKLLKPTRIYVKTIKHLLEDANQQNYKIKGMCNVTGGGLTNLFRLGNHRYEINNPPNPDEIFKIIQEQGNVGDKEMYRTFNMGIGFVVIVSPNNEERVLQVLNQHYKSEIIGKVLEGNSIEITNKATFTSK